MNTLTNEMVKPTDETIFHTMAHTNSYEVSLELTVLSFFFLFADITWLIIIFRCIL
jgi:hypothetical protein